MYRSTSNDFQCRMLSSPKAYTETKLSASQSQAAFLVACGRRKREVATLVNATPETISRWSNIAAFDAAVQEHQQELIDYARARHMALLGKAVDRLEALLDHNNPSIRLRAIWLALQPL